MTRSRFLLIGSLLVAAASFIGLLFTVQPYQCWLLHRWLPDAWGERLWGIDYCFEFESGAWRIWLPIYLSPFILMLPTLPALKRLTGLNRSRWWALLGMLPGVNLLLFGYVAMAPWPVRFSRRAWNYALPASAILAAVFFLYYLMLYLPWLAAKS